MYEIFTLGRSKVARENEEAFVEAWSEFASWASTRPGVGTLRLVRDVERLSPPELEAIDAPS